MTKPTTCPACHDQPAHHGSPCNRCWRQARRHIHEFLWLWHELETARLRLDRLGTTTEKRGSSTDTPLPFGDRAASIQRRFRAALAGWTQVTVDDLAAPTPDDQTAVGLIRHIRAWMPALRRHDGAGEFVGDVAGWRRLLLAAINRPEYREVDAGPCPEPYDDGPCSGTIRVIVPAEDLKAERSLYAICETRTPGIRVCGSVWDTTQFARLGVRIDRRKAAIAAAEALARAIAS